MSVYKMRKAVEAHKVPPGEPEVYINSDGIRRYAEPGTWVLMTITGHFITAMPAFEFLALFEPQ